MCQCRTGPIQAQYHLPQDNLPQHPLAPLLICHLLILCLLLRLIKHSLLFHPIISLKSLIRIPGILMRLCRINHLGGVIHLEHTSPGLWNIQVFNLHLLSSAICHSRFTFAHPTLSNTPLPRILLPNNIMQKQIKRRHKYVGNVYFYSNMNLRY